MKSKKSLNPQENRRVQRFYFYMTVKDRILSSFHKIVQLKARPKGLSTLIFQYVGV